MDSLGCATGCSSSPWLQLETHCAVVLIAFLRDGEEVATRPAGVAPLPELKMIQNDQLSFFFWPSFPACDVSLCTVPPSRLL